jgi:hypothetical protein
MTDVKGSLKLATTLTRLWADDRFVGARQTREFINAWLVTRFAISDHEEAFRETLRRIGADKPYGWHRILSEDAPRFDGLRGRKHWRCPVLKTRGPNEGRACGKYPALQMRVTDPATGEWEMQGWCRQHEAHARIMQAREKALVDVPEPVPNTGGLLPCYIPATNWPDLYMAARSWWKPPFVGIVADDWPVLAKAIEAPRTKVRLTAVEGTGKPETSNRPVPKLRLVKA